MSITTAPFGQTNDGEPVIKTTLTNRHGHRVSLMSWGAAILEVEVPDRNGTLANVNLVFDSLEPYLGTHPGFGSTMGRFCNRIGLGRFSIDGVPHQVTVNHGKHCLHGGKVNFSHLNWDTETIAGDPNGAEAADRADRVRYALVSPDGDEGFPGELTVTTEYCWNDDDELTIEYTASTSAATHVNLTNHSYWNLGGVDSGTVLDHVAVIPADEVLQVDEDLIPTGEMVRVEGTPFDFRSATAFAKRIAALSATKGYDHCYVVAGEAGQLRRAARVIDPQSGRILEVETTQPGMQLYTANHLRGNESSNGHGPHDAFCLETQHYPDTPNHPNFPSTLLRPDEKFHEITVHRFSR
ncbi:aldose epimerase family protein [Allorhodopirellula solitaria]|uniref:Aldose 1-epimerase n=1 Tax=Allorhodopirellula solitaria TaxID=2527987 RepID=A0A5C5XXX5_9BACT|nr:aldose epimerase family protein [Allorhodopirellula solitaria]TWT66422.1 Aldose 1-epimerase precursor [Allorhodopirellula solitaria]